VTLRNEALVLSAIFENNLGEIGRQIPGICHYDPSRGLLITELVPGRSLGGVPLNEIGQDQVKSLGLALSTLHRAVLRTGKYSECQIPLGLSLYRPTLELYRDSSPANVQLLAAIQSDRHLCAHLSKLDHLWAPSTLIHGDVRLDNVVTRADDVDKAIVLVDWEFAGSGDPRWDVACALGDLLNLWLTSTVSRALMASTSPGHAPTGTDSLEQLRKLFKPFFDGYLGDSVLQVKQSFSRECFSFSVARLLQIAYEAHQSRSELDLFAVKAVQMAANIAANCELATVLFLNSGDAAEAHE